ncbi:MAG: phage tail tape-measure protein [Agrobacterium cavarae]
MAELATLGIEAKTNGVDQAVNKLKSLSGAARQAEAAVSGIGSTTANAGRMSASALEGMASRMKAVERVSRDAERALAAQGLAAQKAASAAHVYSIAANDNVNVMGRQHNVANLAAQGFDVVTTAAGGMQPVMIGFQQGLQIAQVAMASTEGFAKTLAASFVAMISPIVILSVGLTTLAAVALQAVNWSKLLASGLNALAASLQTIAPYAAIAAAGFALLYAPAMIGGLVSLIALLGRLQVAAITLAATFAAANPAAAFIIGITAAVAAANVFRDELKDVFGRDIVGDVKNAVNFIIGAFVGGFAGIKAVWSKLPAALGDVVIATANAVIAGVENMLNSVTQAMNGFIQNINGMMKSLPFGMGDSVSIGEIGSVSLGRMDNPYTGSADSVQSAVGSAMSAAQGTDYVGGFGSAISKGASLASAKLKELAKDLTTVDDKSKKKGGGGKTEAEKYSDIVNGANRRIASLKAEQDAIGMTEEASARLKYETELLNQAQQRGITLSAAQKAELGGLAGQMSSIEVATKKAKVALDFAKDAAKGFITDLRTGLQDGEGFWKSFGNAALNVLDKILSKIEDELVNALFSMGGSGSGGGLFGGLLGGLGKIFGFASGGYTGGGAANKAAGIVHGQEYVFSAKATKKIGVGNLDRMHKAAKGYASGGYVAPVRPAANSNSRQGTIPVAVTIGWSRDADGQLRPFVENVSQGVANKTVATAAPKIVATASQQVVPTMASYQRDRAGGDYRNG